MHRPAEINEQIVDVEMCTGTEHKAMHLGKNPRQAIIIFRYSSPRMAIDLKKLRFVLCSKTKQNTRKYNLIFYNSALRLKTCVSEC